jgi:hypothetical protein
MNFYLSNKLFGPYMSYPIILFIWIEILSNPFEIWNVIFLTNKSKSDSEIIAISVYETYYAHSLH